MMTKKAFLATILAFAIASCSITEEGKAQTEKHLISGRDEGASLARTPLYRVSVPKEWKRIEPSPTDSIKDTTRALCEYVVQEGSGRVRISLHNFPSSSMDDRISPHVQISRWRRQFQKIDPVLQSTSPQAFSGYIGYFFEGRGLIDGLDTGMLCWAMQIGPEQYNALSREDCPLQMRADVTIKASGPYSLIKMHRKRIIQFARSFELIEEIPSR